MKIRAFWDVVYSHCSRLNVRGPTNSCITSYPFVHGLFIAMMMEALCTSETSAYYETTWCNIPEGSNLQLESVEILESAGEI
jgi:hypothetical protein